MALLGPSTGGIMPLTPPHSFISPCTHSTASPRLACATGARTETDCPVGGPPFHLGLTPPTSDSTLAHSPNDFIKGLQSPLPPKTRQTYTDPETNWGKRGRCGGGDWELYRLGRAASISFYRNDRLGQGGDRRRAAAVPARSDERLACRPRRDGRPACRPRRDGRPACRPRSDGRPACRPPRPAQTAGRNGQTRLMPELRSLVARLTRTAGDK